jgi:hypothetical protein
VTYPMPCRLTLFQANVEVWAWAAKERVARMAQGFIEAGSVNSSVNLSIQHGTCVPTL